KFHTVCHAGNHGEEKHLEFGDVDIGFITDFVTLKHVRKRSISDVGIRKEHALRVVLHVGSSRFQILRCFFNGFRFWFLNFLGALQEWRAYQRRGSDSNQAQQSLIESDCQGVCYLSSCFNPSEYGCEKSGKYEQSPHDQLESSQTDQVSLVDKDSRRATADV